MSLLAGLPATAASYIALPQMIRAGTDIAYAPLPSKDARGDFVGFNIDLGNEMYKRMQIKYTWVTSDFDALISSLKAKKIDAIISSLSITEKHRQETAFSDKLYAANSHLVIAKGFPIQPTLDSLKGKRVGVLQGSIQEAHVNDNWCSKGVDVMAYANQDLIYSDLTAGRLDAALQDEVVVSEGFLKQPAGKGYTFTSPSVKDKKYFDDGAGIGLRKSNTELKAVLDKTLGELRKDGARDKIASKYFNFNVYGDQYNDVGNWLHHCE